MIKTFLT